MGLLKQIVRSIYDTHTVKRRPFNAAAVFLTAAASIEANALTR
jgi:hypothetical protein